MTVQSYLDFDLLIEGDGNSSTYRVLVDSPTGCPSGSFTVPFAPLELENFILRMGWTGRGVRRIDSPELEAAKNFGQRLFEALFVDDIRTCLYSSIDEATRQGVGLRIRLRLRDAPALVNLPWEFLYNVARNRFLVLSAKTPLVRYLDLPDRIRPFAVTPPLRILVMIASPTDYPPLDVEREWTKLRTALTGLEQRGLVVLERLASPTLGAFQQQLRRGTYHIFHFIGHGGFDKQTQDGVLIMADEEGAGYRVSGQDLGTMLYDHDPLRLAVLNACEGARTAQDDPFSGVAQSLVQQGTPAVIAMQFDVSDRAAIVLSQEFYGAIADGLPVDAALAEARRALFAQGGGVEWGTPVLYMRAPDGRIFDISPSRRLDLLAAGNRAAGPVVTTVAGQSTAAPRSSSQPLVATGLVAQPPPGQLSPAANAGGSVAGSNATPAPQRTHGPQRTVLAMLLAGLCLLALTGWGLQSFTNRSGSNPPVATGPTSGPSGSATTPPTATTLPTPHCVINVNGLNIRTGPDVVFPMVISAGLARNAVVVPDGTSNDGQWITVHVPDGSTAGWIKANPGWLTCTPTDLLSHLAVVAAPPLPVTPTPTVLRPVRVYDFLDHADSAHWSGGEPDTALSFRGSDADPRGFALDRTGEALNDGSMAVHAFETHPAWVANGYIMGCFNDMLGSYTVSSDDHITGSIGFMQGGGAGDVTFRVLVRVERAAPRELGAVALRYGDGVQPFDFPLSQFANRHVVVCLRVDAGPTAAQDWAVWQDVHVSGNRP